MIFNGTQVQSGKCGDFTPMTGIARLDIDEQRATVSFGTPDLRATASTAGTMALYVGGRQSGCYRYKVEIEPPMSAFPYRDLTFLNEIRPELWIVWRQALRMNRW